MDWGRGRQALLCWIGVLAATAAPCAPAQADEIIVSAAASLTNAFQDIGKAYESTHPAHRVIFNFAASDVLLKQIEQGAPVDVFASADEVTMDRAAQQRRVASQTRIDFAANALVLIAPTGGVSPGTLADLTGNVYQRIAIGNPDSVPAGRYAKQALIDAKLWDALAGKFVQAQNVRQALDYVARGEAEAGFVYATDAAAQNARVKVALTITTATAVRYPIAAVNACESKPAACDFIHFVLSASSQATLASYGFRSASP